MNQQPLTHQPVGGYQPQQNNYGYPPIQQQPGMPMHQQPMHGVQPVPNMMSGLVNTNQSQAQGDWMPTPQPIHGVPPGLEYLSQIDQLVIKQQVELLEMVTDIETNNKYKVKNSMGQTVYKAKEKSGFCMRQCCGHNRSFKMEIKDNAGREVLKLDRPFNCNCICFPCCLHEMDVLSPITGQKLGHIKQNWHLTHPRMTVYDSNMQAVFKIEGPCCGCNFCSDVNFQVKDMNGSQIGLVQKQWTGIIKESFTDADNFSVTFPIDLDVKLKAVLLGAVFLVDFMYFEEPANKDSILDN